MSDKTIYKQATLKLVTWGTYVAWLPKKVAVLNKSLTIDWTAYTVESIWASERIMTPEDLAKFEKWFEKWRSVTDI